jgi:Icc-related predicted phosphoesterase
MLRTPKIVIVTHYAPVAETIQGEPPQIWPFLGSSRLAEVIDRHQAALALHGHAHHGQLNGKTTGGVPVHNVAISLLLAHDSTRPYRVFEL